MRPSSESRWKKVMWRCFNELLKAESNKKWKFCLPFSRNSKQNGMSPTEQRKPARSLYTMRNLSDSPQTICSSLRSKLCKPQFLHPSSMSLKATSVWDSRKTLYSSKPHSIWVGVANLCPTRMHLINYCRSTAVLDSRQFLFCCIQLPELLKAWENTRVSYTAT